jgi:hypothetical protein
MKKILYVILHTCTRPDRHDGIVNSWGKDVDYIFYADCDNEEKKIIKVSDDSSYSSNEPKHINVIKYLIENDYQIFNQEFNDNEESKLESITERNRLKGYRNFNLYKNDQYSLCVDIPKVLREGLTKSYFDFYSHLNNRGSSALNSINESIPHQIEALVRLREANHISEDEFLLAKKKILGL